MPQSYFRKAPLAALAACLTACANTDEVPPTPIPTAAEAAEILGCASDEVALCIEVNCELEEWRCTDRADVRDMFKAGDFNN